MYLNIFLRTLVGRYHMDTRGMVGMLVVIVTGYTENSMTLRHCSENTSEAKLAS